MDYKELLIKYILWNTTGNCDCKDCLKDFGLQTLFSKEEFEEMNKIQKEEVNVRYKLAIAARNNNELPH